jgi:hypothetical protein
VLFDGFDPLDVIAPFEVLGAGGMVADHALTVELVSAQGAREAPSGVDAVCLTATARLDPESPAPVSRPNALCTTITFARCIKSENVRSTSETPLLISLSPTMKTATRDHVGNSPPHTAISFR